MLKLFSNFIFKILFFLEFLLKKIFKRKFLGFLYEYIRQNSYTKIKINDNILNFFTPNYYIQYRVNTYFTKEPETLKWIESFENNKSSIFWDIGANIGLYSIYAAIKHPKMKVISFEPSLNNLSTLSRNISINNLSERIIINQFPLTNKKNVYTMFRENNFSEGSGLHSFGFKHDHEGKFFEGKNNYKIYGTSINDILKNNILEIPDYIKIDVDGIEHFILEGANEFLSDKKIKSISVEINEKFKEQTDKCDEILKQNNFKFIQKKSADFNDISGVHSSIFNYVYNKL